MAKKVILAIETSCDDTSVAILHGHELMSMKTRSQIETHSGYGGVIPELASRLHSSAIFNLIEEVLEEVGIELTDLDAIAVTKGPGLVNTLQVGITVAKTIGSRLNIPVYGINHLDAHVYSSFIGKKFSEIPSKGIAVIASGGHTTLALISRRKIEIMGETKDDSIGEAFDKVSKTLGFGLPGGPAIDWIYENFKGDRVKAPVTSMPGYDFSYSGLKSWAIKELKSGESTKEAIAEAFQSSAIEQLMNQINKLADENKGVPILVGGGVSANTLLREKLIKKYGSKVHLPIHEFASDNAAMIGYLLAYQMHQGVEVQEDLTLDAKPRLKAGENE